MSQQFPTVSIGIPTFNGGARVRTAVQSLMKQGYPSLEIIISDNCSDEATADVCRQLVREYPTVRYYRQAENIGMLANFEFLPAHATGKYFMWVADDDEVGSGAIERYVAFLEANPDYSLVSGAIEYSLNGRVTEYEEGFNFEQWSRLARVTGFYFKVVHGAMFHGMMPARLARQVRIRRVIGSDWHFVATMAFLGKIRNLEFVGYMKNFGGSSRDLRKYAKMIGDTDFAGTHPFVKIALDAYREIAFRSDVFATAPFYLRYPMAVCGFISILASHYLTVYPFIIGGRIKRALRHMMPSWR